MRCLSRHLVGLDYVSVDWPTAIDIDRRGLEADNLAAPLARGLLRSLAATGTQVEALVAFRHCRELPSVVLGLTPLAETERLDREIMSGALPQGAARPA